MTLKDISPNYSLLPEHMQGAAKRYIEQGIPPGSFLESVIVNDLRGAISRADHINKNRLEDIVQFFTWEAPSICWGSPEQFKNWVAHQGLQNYEDVLSS